MNRIEKILDSRHTLTREDVIWVLEYVKKKVAEEDPRLLDLSPPRLLKNFHYFSEIAMMLIHRRANYDHELGQLQTWLCEASHGLVPQNPQDS